MTRATKVLGKNGKMRCVDLAGAVGGRCRSYAFAEGATPCGIWKILDKVSCLMSLPTFLRRSLTGD